MSRIRHAAHLFILSASLLLIMGVNPAAAEYRQIDLTIFGMD